MKIELVLQSLTGEAFDQQTANTSSDARLDWHKEVMDQIKGVFELRVFDPNVKRYSAQSLQDIISTTEKKWNASTIWELYK